MIDYRETETGDFLCTTPDGEMCIPPDLNNTHYRLMQEQLAADPVEAQIIAYAPPVVTLAMYQRLAKNAINDNTDVLIADGFIHSSESFDLTRDDQTSALALNAGRMGGQDMTAEKFRGRDSGYTFTDTADFDAWFASGLGRLKTLLNDGSDLKDLIDAAADEAAVDAIVDARV